MLTIRCRSTAQGAPTVALQAAPNKPLASSFPPLILSRRGGWERERERGERRRGPLAGAGALALAWAPLGRVAHDGALREPAGWAHRERLSEVAAANGVRAWRSMRVGNDRICHPNSRSRGSSSSPSPTAALSCSPSKVNWFRFSLCCNRRASSAGTLLLGRQSELSFGCCWPAAVCTSAAAVRKRKLEKREGKWILNWLDLSFVQSIRNFLTCDMERTRMI